MAETASTSAVEAAGSGRTCWVCFASDEDDKDAAWLSPCKCKGSGRWVHEECLERWVDEKQRGDAAARVACAQCKSPYIIMYPRQPIPAELLGWLEKMANRAAPAATGFLMVGSVFWIATTHGAITVFQVLGLYDGLDAMERMDKFCLLLGLPSIPVLLVMGKMAALSWEAKALSLILRIGPPRLSREAAAAAVAEGRGVKDLRSATRVLCGALALPSLAILVGRSCFAHLNGQPVKQAALGAATYLLLRGATRLYYQRSAIVRRSNRKIFNYNPPPPPSDGGREAKEETDTVTTGPAVVESDEEEDFATDDFDEDEETDEGED